MANPERAGHGLCALQRNYPFSRPQAIDRQKHLRRSFRFRRISITDVDVCRIAWVPSRFAEFSQSGNLATKPWV
jgi:hypothetical protein